MKMDAAIPDRMLAPCGITCYACYVHLRAKKSCDGCHGPDGSKPEHCRACKIKDCAAGHGVAFCHECETFPCAIIRRLDRSYRQRYRVSLVENGLRLKAVGVDVWLAEERARWTCPRCGGVISQHDRACSECGQPG